MTNEQAIRWINEIRSNYKSKFGTEAEEVSEAVNLAIEALERTRWIPLPEPPTE